MFNMYLRKEVCNDPLAGFGQHFVGYYSGEFATATIATNFNADRPTYRNKYVMFNCVKYRVIWLSEKVS